MILQRSPNRWSCLVSSFAMALGVPIRELIIIVGHDGSEIIWPELPEPSRRRAHHPQEMIYAASILGFSVTPFEAFPCSVGKVGADPFLVPMIIPAEERMPRIMSGAIGVLTGETPRGQAHAVAWDGYRVLDPSGLVYDAQDFRLEVFWHVLKIKSETP
jgi:hypothetical protein